MFKTHATINKVCLSLNLFKLWEQTQSKYQDMKMQYFSQVITGEPIRSLCNKALVNVILQIVHT